MENTERSFSLSRVNDSGSEETITQSELDALANSVKPLLYSPYPLRTYLQNEHHLHILPANFYSCVPTNNEIEQSFEYQGNGQPYLDDTVFNNGVMLEYLEKLMPFAEEFDPPKEGDLENPSCYTWNSRAFGWSDATGGVKRTV